MDPHVPMLQRSVSRRNVGLATMAAPLLGLMPTAPSAAAAVTIVTSPFAAGTTSVFNGSAPVSDADGWLFDLPASSTATGDRRSELWWTANGAPAAYGEGDVANYSAVISADLGAAADTAADWHVVWQLAGPTNGVWKGPAQTVTIANGQLRMTGGSGHPDHAPAAGQYYQWFKDLAPYRNGQAYALRIQTYLTANPEQGWISAWVNGTKILDHWVPQSHTGLRPGSLLPGQPIVNSRAGLFRGTLSGGSAPSYRQWVRHANPLVF